MERLRIERFLDVCRGNNPTAYGRRFWYFSGLCGRYKNYHDRTSMYNG